MKRKVEFCAGSGAAGADGRLAGDFDRCPVCGRGRVLVVVSGVLAVHEAPAPAVAGGAE